MRCKSCHLDLPEASFYVSNKARCKECIKASVRRNRLEKIDYYRSYDRKRQNRPDRVAARKAYQRTEAFRLSHAVAAKRWDVANAIRKKAIEAVNNAIRDGRLDRQPCFVCGATAQAHHPDYSAPLAVSWLCAKHHALLHKEHREYEREMA